MIQEAENFKEEDLKFKKKVKVMNVLDYLKNKKKFNEEEKNK